MPLCLRENQAESHGPVQEVVGAKIIAKSGDRLDNKDTARQKRMARDGLHPGNTDMTQQKTRLTAILLASLLPAFVFARWIPPASTDQEEAVLFVVTVNGKDGYMDRDGKIVIEPTFDRAYPFSDGLAAIEKQQRWGFIDTSGEIVIEPQFISVGLFSEGLATFQGKRQSTKFGYIDKTGKVVIQPQFDEAEAFRNGVARVGFATLQGRLLSKIADVGLECHHKYIDRTGKIVPNPSPLHHAAGIPGELIPFTKNDLVGYLRAQGEVAIPPQFHVGSDFSEGLACVSKEALFGYIDSRGEWVIPPRFQYANDFSEGLAAVSLGESGWGFIDRAGNEVIPGKFTWVYGGFRHGIAEVAWDRKRGYINKKGDWVWKPSE